MMDEPRPNVPFLILLALSVVLALANLPIPGKWVHLWAFILIVLDVLNRTLQRNPKLDLIYIWYAGYMYSVFIDGFFSSDKIIQNVGVYYYDKASMIIAGSMAALLLGYNLSSSKKKSVESSYYLVSKSTVIFIVANILLFIALSYQDIVNGFLSGRLWIYSDIVRGREFATMYITRDISAIFTQTYVTTTALIMPALIGYYFHRIKNHSIFVALLISAPYLMYEFSNGSRHNFFISIVGLLLTTFRRHMFNLNLKLVSKLGAVALVVFSATVVQYYGRMHGFALDNIVYNQSSQDMKFEGTVETLAMFAGYMEGKPPLLGQEVMIILTYFIPRKFWPDKPVGAGQWMLREISTSVTNPVHSAAVSFAGTMFLDWGFHFGILSCILLGLLIRKMNSTLMASFDGQGPTIILAGTLIGLELYAVRSLLAAIIQMYALLLFYYLYKLVFCKKVHFDQPNRLRQQ